jgi:hypothetical protein
MYPYLLDRHVYTMDKIFGNLQVFIAGKGNFIYIKDEFGTIIVPYLSSGHIVQNS